MITNDSPFTMKSIHSSVSTHLIRSLLLLKSKECYHGIEILIAVSFEIYFDNFGTPNSILLMKDPDPADSDCAESSSICIPNDDPPRSTREPFDKLSKFISLEELSGSDITGVAMRAPFWRSFLNGTGSANSSGPPSYVEIFYHFGRVSQR